MTVRYRMKFDGRYYEFWQEFADKESAQLEAGRIKGTGMAKTVRVVLVDSKLHHGKAWAVYYISNWTT